MLDIPCEGNDDPIFLFESSEGKIAHAYEKAYCYSQFFDFSMYCVRLLQCEIGYYVIWSLFWGMSLPYDDFSTGWKVGIFIHPTIAHYISVLLHDKVHHDHSLGHLDNFPYILAHFHHYICHTHASDPRDNALYIVTLHLKIAKPHSHSYIPAWNLLYTELHPSIDIPHILQSAHWYTIRDICPRLHTVRLHCHVSNHFWNHQYIDLLHNFKGIPFALRC